MEDSPTEREVVDSLRNQVPLRSLPGVRISDVREQPEQPFDVSLELTAGTNRVLVLGEIKSSFTPRVLEQIAPWIRRLKALRPEMSVAVIAPALSPQAQAYCIENGLDFLDLAGNIFINVPGRLTLQRTGMRDAEKSKPSKDTARSVNVFSGRSSRVLRVLLERPDSWTLTEIAKEMSAESERTAARFAGSALDFSISLGAISKALASLEEQLLIRRRGQAVLVPEAARLLREWADKYKERYRWRLRSSFQVANPFGRDVADVARGLRPLIEGPFLFTSAAAASLVAPFVDVDVVDVFLLPDSDGTRLRQLKPGASQGPAIRFIYPYDAGVFMYSSLQGDVPMTSGVQTYLDLYARGGRDLKQADYLLANVLEQKWRGQ